MREGGVALLVADLAGSTAMYEALGDDVARQRIGACLQLVATATAERDGRLVKTLGDGALCVFGSSHAALDAAVAMRDAIAERGLMLRAAIHVGTVVEDGGDVFGDAVNTAARLCDVATGSEVLVSDDARRALPPDACARLTRLPPVALRGKRDPVQVYVSPSAGGGVRTADIDEALQQPAHASRVELIVGDAMATLEQGGITLGRGDKCGLVVPSIHASRVHATISRIGANFYLQDTSSNGTWLQPDAQPALRLHRERAPLMGRGQIYCGSNPARRGALAVGYSVT